jgi:hypothetical protein
MGGGGEEGWRVVDLPDEELLQRLIARDGPLPERSWSHSAEAECRYSELYDGEPCPWCEAEKRRRERETAAQA